jgi:hypothetical protein
MAWDRSVALRKEIGDMKGSDAKNANSKSTNSFEQNVDMKFALKAGH